MLLHQIREGKTSAYQKLFDHFYEDLVNTAYRYLYDEAESEDLVQEVFIYLWEYAADIEIHTTLKGYLFRMVKNRCLNKLKAVKVIDSTNTIAIQQLFEDIPGEEEVHDTVQNERYNQLMRAIEALPDKMKEILMLKVRHNYKYEEIADQLGISVNTVKTQLKNARKRINKIMPVVFLLWWFSR
ncbi:RNA polymerase sigma-70 factor, ECF subfamily [Sinomicrobium oceani]|uniref:RNA polymerase sigma-70 factor, ECF subfamily n=1 Tax=Sinomicrobium oceani TaxID=1150368 RepID=A0A1K1PY60_9FLAO|nr:RNA polymerase sigma-70 factor, ECF subfamily [Sinomicrobium oceani]